MRLFYSILLLILYTSCQLQKENQIKELTILGTVHFPTAGVTSDSIYNAIERANPEVILLERDSTAFDDNFNPLFDDQENESIAIKKYLKNHPNVSIRPIEFEGRNSYRKQIGLYPQANEVFQKLNEIARAGNLSQDEQLVWNKFANYWGQMEQLSAKSLKALNTENSDALLEKAKQIQYTEMKKFVSARDEFNKLMIDSKGDSISLKDYFSKWEQFEHYDRNNAMTANTIRTINHESERSFILIVGYHHRYFIKNKIKETAPNIQLKEYYQ